MEKKHQTLKELPISERPYEKCEKSGVEALSDAELLAVTLPEKNYKRYLESGK